MSDYLYWILLTDFIVGGSIGAAITACFMSWRREDREDEGL